MNNWRKKLLLEAEPFEPFGDMENDMGGMSGGGPGDIKMTDGKPKQISKLSDLPRMQFSEYEKALIAAGIAFADIPLKMEEIVRGSSNSYRSAQQLLNMGILETDGVGYSLTDIGEEVAASLGFLVDDNNGESPELTDQARALVYNTLI